VKCKKMKFFCVTCSRKKGRKVMHELDDYKVMDKTMHRKKKIKGQRKKVKGKAFTRRVAIGKCPESGSTMWKFVKKGVK